MRVLGYTQHATRNTQHATQKGGSSTQMRRNTLFLLALLLLAACGGTETPAVTAPGAPLVTVYHAPT